VHNYEVPTGFWKSVCEDVDHPLACVDMDSQFTWVNGAFEQLVGYSIAELVGKTWMSITVQEDVGGDLASVEAVIEGKISAYKLSKEYIHKRGHIVRVDLTVRRFPSSVLEDMTCFRVEAPIAKIDAKKLQDVQRTLMNDLIELRGRIERNEEHIEQNTKGIAINVGDSIGGDRVGRDKNSDAAIKFIAGTLIAMCITMAWLMYYVASVSNKTPMQAPPSMPGEGK